MRKVYNFSAGPAMLPEAVLQKAQADMLDWNDTGMSIMEIGHRTADFKVVADQAEANLRELMGIPSHYQVLFLSGGATAQFAMVPLNLFQANPTADYVDTGIWSKKAIQEAARYGKVSIAARLERRNQLACIPPQDQWSLNNRARYLHYTPNETIDGVEFNWVPEVGEVPLVADMSSMILSRPIDVAKYGIIYAGAQKNIGQAGVTIVIIRDDLIGDALPNTPTLYSYQTQASQHSFYNTPPTYSWYIAGLTLAWLKSQGGVQAIYEVNQRKAQKLYTYIDQHADFYYSNVDPSCRSLMNVVFNIRDDALLTTFLSESHHEGLTNLKGHRVVGGLRASIYNAMPETGVDKLIAFMDDFRQRNT